MNAALIEKWTAVSIELNIKVDFNVTFELDSEKFDVPVLIKNFGAESGMVLHFPNSLSAEQLDKLFEHQFGSCQLSKNEQSSYDLDDVKEMLKDWGWFGTSELKPQWIEDKT